MSERSFEEVLEEHKGIVVTLARRYSSKGTIPIDEAMQEARLALWTALRTYAPEAGMPTKFSTYAYSVINRALMNLVMNRQTVIYTPRQASLARWYQLKVPTVSLDEVVTEFGMNRHEFIAPEEGEGVDEGQSELLMAVLESLSAEDARVIKQRYFEERTLKCIAEAEGITREAVRQRELRALNRLRRKLRACPQTRRELELV